MTKQTKAPSLLVPGKKLLNEQGRPIPRPFMKPPTEGWEQNPKNPGEHAKRVGALAFSVTQNIPVPGGGQMTAVTAMNLAVNRAASHYFREPVEAFAYCDLILDAASYDETQPEVSDDKKELDQPEVSE